MNGDSVLGPWANDVSTLAAEFKAGDPFPLLVIDGFLEESFAKRLLAEFPSIEGMAHSRDYVFGDKREEADFAKAGPACKAYYDYLLSPEFAHIVRHPRRLQHPPQAQGLAAGSERPALPEQGLEA
jgi:hypothetical protein